MKKCLVHQPKLSFSKCSDLDKFLLELKKNPLIADQDQIWVAYRITYAKWASTHFPRVFMIFWHNISELENVWFLVVIQWLHHSFMQTQNLSVPSPLGFPAACSAPATSMPHQLPSKLCGSTIWDQSITCLRNGGCIAPASAMQPGDQPFAWFLTPTLN